MHDNFFKMPNLKQILRPGMGFGFLPWYLEKKMWMLTAKISQVNNSFILL